MGGILIIVVIIVMVVVGIVTADRAQRCQPLLLLVPFRGRGARGGWNGLRSRPTIKSARARVVRRRCRGTGTVIGGGGCSFLFLVLVVGEVSLDGSREIPIVGAEVERSLLRG